MKSTSFILILLLFTLVGNCNKAKKSSDSVLFLLQQPSETPAPKIPEKTEQSEPVATAVVTLPESVNNTNPVATQPTIATSVSPNPATNGSNSTIITDTGSTTNNQTGTGTGSTSNSTTNSTSTNTTIVYNVVIGQGRNNIVATSGDDKITGNAGGKEITTGAGKDILVYKNLQDVGHTIKDFTVGDDKFDFSALLSSIGYTGNNPFRDGYMKVVQGSSATSSRIQIDRDGPGSGIFRNFLVVDGVRPIDLEQMSNFIFTVETAKLDSNPSTLATFLLNPVNNNKWMAAGFCFVLGLGLIALTINRKLPKQNN